MKHDKWKDRDTLAYQESVTAPLNWSFDEDNNGIDEDEESNEENEDPAVTIKSAIEKVSKSLCLIKIMIAHKIIWAIRSSLQHQQTWYTEVKITLLNLDTSPIKVSLMLIPDVKTRWSSTHQMLCKSKWPAPSKQQSDQALFYQDMLLIFSQSLTVLWQRIGILMSPSWDTSKGSPAQLANRPWYEICESTTKTKKLASEIRGCREMYIMPKCKKVSHWVWCSSH